MKKFKVLTSLKQRVDVIIVDLRAKESALTTRLVLAYNGIIVCFLAIYNQYIVEYYVQDQIFIYSKLKK